MSDELTHLPRLHLVSLPLSLGLAFNPDPRIWTVRRANISCFAPTFLGPARARTPGLASAPTEWPFRAPAIFYIPAPAPVPAPAPAPAPTFTLAPVSLTPSPARRGP